MKAGAAPAPKTPAPGDRAGPPARNPPRRLGAGGEKGWAKNITPDIARPRHPHNHHGSGLGIHRWVVDSTGGVSGLAWRRTRTLGDTRTRVQKVIGNRVTRPAC